MEKNKIGNVMGFFGVFFILVLTISLSPINAINISLNTSVSKAQYGDVINFVGIVDIDTNERVPIENISVKAVDENNSVIDSCVFDVDGVKLSDCSNFLNISLIKKNTNLSFGELYAKGFGRNSSMSFDEIVETNFGYGFGEEYNSLGGDELRYNISWKSPSIIKNTSEKVFFVLEVSALENDIDFVYKPINESEVVIEMEKPVALLKSNFYEVDEGQKVVLDGSDSFDPNGFNISFYNVFLNGSLIKSSSVPVFDLNLASGNYSLDFVVVNEYGIESDDFEFDVVVKSLLSSESLALRVESMFNENKEIEFYILNDKNISGRVLEIEPKINCFGIDFDLVGEYDNSIILKSDISEYKLKVDKNSFDLKVPVSNLCEFIVNMKDDLGNKLSLSKAVSFEYFDNDNYKEVVELNNGVDITNYIFHSFNKKFDKGYNVIDFNFLNDGEVDIKVDFTVIIQDLDYLYSESLKVPSNQKIEGGVPLFIEDRVKAGTYPMRITYRINEEDTKTKYGFVEVK